MARRLKTTLHLSNIKNSILTSQRTFRTHYKDQYGAAVGGNNQNLLRESHRRKIICGQNGDILNVTVDVSTMYSIVTAWALNSSNKNTLTLNVLPCRYTSLGYRRCGCSDCVTSWVRTPPSLVGR
jgi:hypothetical protein